METHEEIGETAGAPAPRPLWKRLLPVGIVIASLVTLYASGARDYLSFDALKEFQGSLRQWAAANPLLAPVIVAAIYALGTAVSLPGMVWVTLAAGFLFGTVVGSIAVVFGATAGAVVIFLIARFALADVLRAKAGKWIEKVDKGMEDGQISYLITVRMIPVIPFWIANLVPAFLDVKTWTFAWTTFVGIIPVVAIYCSVGAGIGTLLDAGEEPNLGAILADPKVILPLVGLIGFSVLPIVLSKLKKRAKGAPANV